jgi:hypothetical protein
MASRNVRKLKVYIRKLLASKTPHFQEMVEDLKKQFPSSADTALRQLLRSEDKRIAASKKLLGLAEKALKELDEAILEGQVPKGLEVDVATSRAP